MYVQFSLLPTRTLTTLEKKHKIFSNIHILVSLSVYMYLYFFSRISTAITKTRSIAYNSNIMCIHPSPPPPLFFPLGSS